MHTVICPYCQMNAKLVTGAEVYPHRPDLADKRFWSCKRCDAYVGCHPAQDRGGDASVPLGTLANAELRRKRSEAHAVFDLMWKSAGAPMTRQEAYAWLAEQMDIEAHACYIGSFNVRQCNQVMAVMAAREKA
jgi:hypothetical protein